MTSDTQDPLYAKLKEIRARVSAGEGEEVLREARQGSEPDWLVIADVSLRSDDPSGARDAGERALDMYEKKGNIRGQIIAIQLLMDAYLAMSESGKALAQSVKGISLAWAVESKTAEAALLHSSATAFIMQWRFAQAQRAASRAATLFRQAGDLTGEAIALETAANASVSYNPNEAYRDTSVDKKLLGEAQGPPGGQAMMDAVRYGQTSVLYEKKPWQPISKFIPVMSQRPRVEVEQTKLGTNRMGNDGKPLFQPKSYNWIRPMHRTNDAYYHMVLQSAGRII